MIHGVEQFMIDGIAFLSRGDDGVLRIATLNLEPFAPGQGKWLDDEKDYALLTSADGTPYPMAVAREAILCWRYRRNDDKDWLSRVAMAAEIKGLEIAVFGKGANDKARGREIEQLGLDLRTSL